MKQVFLMSIITIILSACQTIGFIEINPKEPTKLNKNYDNFAEDLWSKPKARSYVSLDNIRGKDLIINNFVTAGGKVYRTVNGVLEILNLENGAVEQELILEVSDTSLGLAVGYNTFTYSDQKGNFYVHDLESGYLRWKKSLNDLVITKSLITPRSIFVQTTSDKLYALNFRSGETIWSKSAQAPLLSIRGTAEPFFYEGIIFATFSNGRLAAIRANDGIQIWEKPISFLKGTTELEKLMDSDSSAVAFGESVYAANYNGSISKFQIRTGEKDFSIDFSTSKPIVLYREKIIGTTNEDEIMAFDAVNGNILWQLDDFKFRRISNLVEDSGELFFGDIDGFIHKIDAEDGKILGIENARMGHIKQLSLSSRKIFVLDFQGRLKAFEID